MDQEKNQEHLIARRASTWAPPWGQTGACGKVGERGRNADCGGWENKT
jgi:hypothetical protein